jgi:hypothetical protein
MYPACSYYTSGAAGAGSAGAAAAAADTIRVHRGTGAEYPASATSTLTITESIRVCTEMEISSFSSSMAEIQVHIVEGIGCHFGDLLQRMDERVVPGNGFFGNEWMKAKSFQKEKESKVGLCSTFSCRHPHCHPPKVQ